MILPELAVPLPSRFVRAAEIGKGARTRPGELRDEMVRRTDTLQKFALVICIRPSRPVKPLPAEAYALPAVISEPRFQQTSSTAHEGQSVVSYSTAHDL